MQDLILHEVDFNGDIWSLRGKNEKQLYQNNSFVCKLRREHEEGVFDKLISTNNTLFLHEIMDKQSFLYLINKEEGMKGEVFPSSLTPKISSIQGFRVQGNVMVSNFSHGLWYVTQIEEKQFNKYCIPHPVIPAISSLDDQILHASYNSLTGRTLAGINNREIMNFQGKLRVATFHKGIPLVIASNSLQYCHYWNGKTIENEGTLIKIHLGTKDVLTYTIGKTSFDTGIY